MISAGPHTLGHFPISGYVSEGIFGPVQSCTRDPSEHGSDWDAGAQYCSGMPTKHIFLTQADSCGNHTHRSCRRRTCQSQMQQDWPLPQVSRPQESPIFWGGCNTKTMLQCLMQMRPPEPWQTPEV